MRRRKQATGHSVERLRLAGRLESLQEEGRLLIVGTAYSRDLGEVDFFIEYGESSAAHLSVGLPRLCFSRENSRFHGADRVRALSSAWLEHLLYTQGVGGSSPSAPTWGCPG